VTPDVIDAAQMLRTHAEAHGDRQTMLGLGGYKAVTSEVWDSHRYGVTSKIWHPTTDNMGMGFTVDAWRSMSTCKSVRDPGKLAFCSFDDYNWDWTIYHLSKIGCFGQPVKIVQLASPRVFHLGGSCGVHQTNKVRVAAPTCTPEPGRST